MIGDPVRHSLSPLIHNAGFSARGLDWAYVAFTVIDGDVPRALDGVRALGVRGLSVTMPHKEAVAEHVDELTEAAAALGSVNCVVNRDGDLLGDNTDGAGFVAGLRHELDMDPGGLSCVVVGAGGAARAVVAALADAGAARIGVLNRSRERARTAVELAGATGSIATPTDLGEADLVVNATPVGMSDDAVPFDPSLLHAGQSVVDLIYHPLRTPLLLEAEQRGCRTANGVSMLLFQAIAQWEQWTGVEAPVEQMNAALRAAVGENGRLPGNC